MIPCEPYTVEIDCPICVRKTLHLVEFEEVNFILREVYFKCTCQNCQKLSFMLHGEPTEPFYYKASYDFWESMCPLSDLPPEN